MSEKLSSAWFDHFRETVNKDMNPIKYLGIDPGKSNGVCGYDAKYYLNFMMTVNASDIIQFIHCFEKVDTCIIEDFKLYPNKAGVQKYSDMETSRVIGRVEAWAELNNVNLVKQGATIKTTGYYWIGQKPPSKSNPRNHELDANVHFMYWAVKHNKIDARELLKRVPHA